MPAPTPAARDALLNEFAAKVHMPYMVMAGVLVLLAIWIVRSSLPEIRPSGANSAAEQGHADARSHGPCASFAAASGSGWPTPPKAL